MSTEWKEYKLGDIIICNDSSYSSKKDNWKFINYLDTGNITENKVSDIQYLNVDLDKIPSRAKRKIQKGDIVYSTVRPNQKHYGIIKTDIENLLVSTGFTTIRAKDKIADTNYIFWFLSQNIITEKLHTIAEHSTSAYPSIKSSDIESLTINLPPLPEQKRIAKILGDLDDKIELNSRMNETLEGMAQTLFKSWFVDFDPVIDNALEAGNKIPEEFTTRAQTRQSLKTTGEYPQLPENIRSLFPSSFTHTDQLGWIPEGWEVKAVGNIGKIITGKTPPKNIEDAYSSTGIPFITPSDIDTNLLTCSSQRSLSVNGQKTIAKSKLPANSICVTCIGSQMGKTVLVKEESFTNQQLNSIIPNDPSFTNYTLLNLRNRQHEIFTIGSSGSTMPIINKTHFSKLSILFPNKNILIAFNAKIETNINKIYHNTKENILLTKQRNTLLPKLLSENNN